MRKSVLLCFVLCVSSLFLCRIDADAQDNSNKEFTEVSTQGAQTNVEGNWVPSTEVGTVQESELAREMIAVEKNEDKDAAAAEVAKSEDARRANQLKKAQNASENDKYGFAITIIAMGIVILALVILSLLFLGFGKISESFQKAQKREAHGVSESDAEDHHEELDSGEVIAAISMALAEHTGQGHDIEDTILTIRKLRKAYSPWNSKIYNMRSNIEHSKAGAIKVKK